MTQTSNTNDPSVDARERARLLALQAMALAERADIARLEQGVREIQQYLAGELEMELEDEEENAFPALARQGLRGEVEEAMHQHALLRGLRYKLMRIQPEEPERWREVLLEIAASLRRHAELEEDLRRGGTEKRC